MYIRKCVLEGASAQVSPCTLRAKFSYLPRHPKELRVDAGNVFHILDDCPMVKGSFRVSRLSNDGTDAEQGIVPNSFRAQRYICEQGQGKRVGLEIGQQDIQVGVNYDAVVSADVVSEPYEEVEPYNDIRPVLVFGALAPLVVSRLMEEFPSQFFAVSLGEWFEEGGGGW